MRVAVPAMGSHGDVEPFLALAAGLRRRGHTVVVATHAEFAALVTGARLAAALTDALRRRHGARRIAQALAAEDGVAAAVDLLEARL